MEFSSTENTALAGQRVAIAARLASLTLAEAAALLERSGAKFCRTVTRSTTLLVVGEEDWPLQGNGRLSQKLQTARRLQQDGQALDIIPEGELLRRLGVCDIEHSICRRYSLLELVRVLGVNRDRIRSSAPV
jgi:NAD-dependent DNA ligase